VERVYQEVPLGLGRCVVREGKLCFRSERTEDVVYRQPDLGVVSSSCSHLDVIEVKVSYSDSLENVVVYPTARKVTLSTETGGWTVPTFRLSVVVVSLGGGVRCSGPAFDDLGGGVLCDIVRREWESIRKTTRERERQTGEGWWMWKGDHDEWHFFRGHSYGTGVPAHRDL
jgi:hypothetical protein